MKSSPVLDVSRTRVVLAITNATISKKQTLKKMREMSRPSPCRQYHFSWSETTIMKPFRPILSLPNGYSSGQEVLTSMNISLALQTVKVQML